MKNKYFYLTAALVFTGFLFQTGWAEAATFYVDRNSIGGRCTNGKKNPGTDPKSPFCSIRKAAQAAKKGDTVWVRKGVYREDLVLKEKATASEPIKFSAYESENVSIRPKGNLANAVTIYGEYYIFENFNVKHDGATARANYYNIAVNGNHNTIRNITIIGDDYINNYLVKGAKERGISIKGEGNLIENCHIEKMAFNPYEVDGVKNTFKNNSAKNFNGNCFKLSTTNNVLSGNLIEHNYCQGSNTSDGIQLQTDFSLSEAKQRTTTGGRGYIIKNNILVDMAENCIDLKASSDILVEGNICHGSTGSNSGGYSSSYDPACVCKKGETSIRCHPSCENRFGGIGGITHGSHRKSERVIIRDNVFYDNLGGAAAHKDWMFYHNSVLNNNRDYTGPNSQFVGIYRDFPGAYHISFLGVQVAGSGVAVKNNFIGYHKQAEVMLAPIYDADLDYNAYCPDAVFIEKRPGKSKSKRSYPSMGFESWQSFLKSYNAIKGNDLHSFVAKPNFTNAPDDINGPHDQFDFTLKSDSALIDKGGPLTTTIEQGNGKTLTVNNAKYFFDGYGVIKGDRIKVGSNQVVTVSSIDYENNRITLDQAVSWKKDDPVYYCRTANCFEGSAPDIGAFENGGS